jgi:hypothetical protein
MTFRSPRQQAAVSVGHRGVVARLGPQPTVVHGLVSVAHAW